MHKITARIGASLLSIFALNSMAEQTIEYQYDELGRLTFVKDNVNGNRDYDYDPAGNRTSVATNTEQDTVQLPVPGKPTGLQCYENWGPGAWKGQWNAVAGAHHYVFKASNRSEVTVLGTDTGPTPIEQSSRPCSWVKACNANNQCSLNAYF